METYVQQTYELLQTIAEDLADHLSSPDNDVKVVISLSVSKTQQPQRMPRFM
ncbi:hypothetical protein ACOALA_13715 [Alicyclobacillus acidoterrestris]|uniref:hypothetical protein n=1 Tax=Alicyclobacillus TaxID=29330 RepID=UPI001A8D8820|nr:hypothetical protein [Alicyclobacillus suci]